MSLMRSSSSSSSQAQLSLDKEAQRDVTFWDIGPNSNHRSVLVLVLNQVHLHQLHFSPPVPPPVSLSSVTTGWYVMEGEVVEVCFLFVSCPQCLWSSLCSSLSGSRASSSSCRILFSAWKPARLPRVFLFLLPNLTELENENELTSPRLLLDPASVPVSPSLPSHLAQRSAAV